MMRFTPLRASTLVLVAAGAALSGLGCGSSNSDGSHATGGQAGSAASGAGGAGALPGSGGSAVTGGTAGTSSSSGGTGAKGGTSGGTADAGNSAGGTSMSAGGNGATAGSGGSTSSGGAAGMASTSGGTGGSGTGGTGAAAGGAAAGSSAQGAGSGGMPATGGKGGGGGLAGAVPSKGCGSPAPATGPLQIDVSGTKRDYILRLPDGYDANTPHRIIFAFHGMQGSADQVDKGDPPNPGLDPTGPYYGIKDESTDTIFVAGQALDGGWTNSNGRDIDYVKALVSDLEGKLCIDESRVFATGFSFGAIMTITVACNMADVFRAVAPMSGSLQNGCPSSEHSIAYWASHGTMDTTIDISKGEAARDEFVKRNKCSTTTMPTTPEGCIAYQGCADGYPVNWCPFDGIHQPPPFSGPAIWGFLSQF